MLIKELMKILEASYSLSSVGLKVDSQVHAKLDSAAEEDELDAQCFGLELEDGKVVKVYVTQSEADEFEEALSKRLGQDDDIQTAIEELSKEFEIINIIWPEGSGPDDVEDIDDSSGSVEDIPGAKDDEVDTDQLSSDGSESLNPNIDYQEPKRESLASVFANRIMSSISEVKMSHLNKGEQDASDSEENEEKNPGDSNSPEVEEKKSSWEIEKEDDEIILSTKKFRIEFDSYETDILIASFRDKKIARFKNENGQVIYVFAPRGNEYLLKTPDYPHGIKIPAEIVKQVIGNE